MDCCDTSGLLPLESGLAKLLNSVAALNRTETVPLSELDQRVLAQSIHCPIQVPPADNSAMDGYALKAEDGVFDKQLKLVGQSLAGHCYQGELKQGECVRIMTGAVIPTAATAVIMQEQVQLSECGQWITLQKSVLKGQNIRQAGEDLKQDSMLFKTGYRLKAVDLGLLASVGIDNAIVFQRPKVALLSNGDELVEPGYALASGQIYESNRYGLAALLRRLDLDVTEFGIIPDQPTQLRSAMLKAANYDAVISSGGVSVGDADYIKQLLEELGQIAFWQLAIKPGKPFAYGKLGNAHYFGLPGNPVSAMVTCHQLAIPALRKLAGEEPNLPSMITAIAAEPVKKWPGRTDFQRAIYQNNEQGELLVKTTGKQGSGLLSSFSQANCYLVLERERGDVKAGERVQILLFDRLLS